MDDEALAFFDVSTDAGVVLAKTFLETELVLHASEDEAEKDSIEQVIHNQPSNNRVAPALTPDQIRSQSKQVSFPTKATSKPRPPSLSTPQRGRPCSTRDLEIDDLNEIEGDGTIVYIDHREGRSTLPAYLQGLGFETVFTQLPCGDLRLSERVLIERKTTRDLLESIKSGRLLHQCRSLKAARRPLLLVETGGEAQYSVHPNAVLGALAHITLDLGLPVMTVKGAMEAAHFVAVAAAREHDALERLRSFAEQEGLAQPDVSASVAVARRELAAIEAQPDEHHPWLDSKSEHLKRCYRPAVEPLITEENESIVMAFAPDLGGLFSAQPEAVVKASGCSLDESEGPRGAVARRTYEPMSRTRVLS